MTVRKGEVETLTDAGSKALGIRVFVGRRTATSYTSDFSAEALRRLVDETVAMARVTGEDPAAGLPDEMVPPEALDLGLHDPGPAARAPADRIERARRRRPPRWRPRPEITNSQGGSYASGEATVVLANTRASWARTARRRSRSPVVPVAERGSQMERDYCTTRPRPRRPAFARESAASPALRTLRRLGRGSVPTCEVPVVFDPETGAEIPATSLPGARIRLLGLHRNATFLKGRVGEIVASPLLTGWTKGCGRAASARGLSKGEGLPTRRNVPLEPGCCATTSATPMRPARSGPLHG